MAIADTAKLLASLELEDKFTPGIKKASASMGLLEQRFGKIGKSAQQGLGAAASNITKLGVVAAGFVASQVAFGVRTLQELDSLTAQTTAVIASTGNAAGVTADQVRALANQLEDLTTVDDKVVQAGANVLLRYTQIGNDVFPRATRAATDMAVALAQGDVGAADVAASAKLLGKALADPEKGMTALRKAGVVLTDAQEKEIKTLAKAGKAQEAQIALLTALEKVYGKAGEAAGKTAAADFARFGDAIEEAQMALATGLLPVIREATVWMTTKLKDPATISAITSAGRALAGFLRDGLAAAQTIPWGQIVDAMRGAATAGKTILDVFLGMPDWVKTAVISGWGLNKLTGGAFGDIVGELGNGLIKGVLGMNAAVVNINAGVVNGAPGAGTPGTPGTTPPAGPSGITVPFIGTVAAFSSSWFGDWFKPGTWEFSDAFKKRLLKGSNGATAPSGRPLYSLVTPPAQVAAAYQSYRAGERQSLFNPSEMQRAVSAGVKDGMDRSNLTKLFADSQVIREKTGQKWSGNALRSLIGGKAAVGAETTTLAQAVTAALVNNLGRKETVSKDTADLASAKANLATLVSLQRRFNAQGDTKSAATIGTEIARLRNAMKVDLTNNVTVNVTANSVTSRTRITQSYGNLGTANRVGVL